MSRRRANRRLAAVLVVTAAAGCRIEPAARRPDAAPEEPGLTARVPEILAAQAAAWNGGDLDGFMAAYHRSPETTYIGTAGLLEGFDAIRERYAPLFAPGAARDSLRFEALRTRELDPRVGIATARYVLHRDGEITSTGPFTLVFLRVEGAWKIVHDQSAADPTPVAAEPPR